jgi:hypothetical protein
MYSRIQTERESTISIKTRHIRGDGYYRVYPTRRLCLPPSLETGSRNSRKKDTNGGIRRKKKYDMLLAGKCFEQGMFFNDAKGEKWKTIGFFLKGYFGDNDVAYTLFDTFSQLCPSQYSAYENKEKWDGFSVNGDKYDSFGIFVN